MNRKQIVVIVIVILLACLLAAFTPGGRARMRPTPQPQVEEHGEAQTTSTPVYDADCVGMTMTECSIVRQTAYAQTPQPTYEVIWISDQLITTGPDDLGYPAP